MPVALITGCGRGIGKELALTLAQRGYAIAALDKSDEGLGPLAQAIEAQHGTCATSVADVTESASLLAAVERLEQQLGPVDLLIANAGIGFETSALRLDAEALARIINVNLIGVANSMAAVLPGMIGRGRGQLVAISSVASFRGLPRMLGYCASKAGVNTLMESIRAEVRPLGLHVTTICPSWIRTPMTAHLHGLSNVLDLETAVKHIVWAIDKRCPFYAFPRSAVWWLRLLRCLPYSWQDAILAQYSRRTK